MTALENLLVAERDNSGESILSPFIKWKSDEKEAAERDCSLSELFELKSKMKNQRDELSGGQLKLLETARSLERGSNVILLDEPVAGILPSLGHEILSRLRSTAKELSLATAIVEHRLDILFEYCDVVYALDRGRVIACESPDKIKQNKSVIDSYLGT
jgi:branched-chain amino acid transport system ATP-binding protein